MAKSAKRFRLFAGPNGSGKSTIIKNVKETVIESLYVDCGVYVNADDIAVDLAGDSFSFSNFKLNIEDVSLLYEYVKSSGFLRNDFTFEVFQNCFKLEENCVKLLIPECKEYLAQVLSNFTIVQLLLRGCKCSMESVFSHESKVELLRFAKSKGYKVYLYFIATEDPEINKERVKARVTKGGHDVPPDKIENRYYKSLELLYEAAQIVYRCYFFDNSSNNINEQQTVTNFKCVDISKDWDITNIDTIPEWFVKYYINKRKIVEL